MWKQVLESSLPIILQVIGVGLASLLAWLVAKVIKKFNLNEVEQSAIDALATGVNETYIAVVKDIKAKAADGKLTEDERKEVKAIAIAKAKEVAKGSAKKLLTTMAQERLSTWVDKLVQKAKGK